MGRITQNARGQNISLKWLTTTGHIILMWKMGERWPQLSCGQKNARVVGGGWAYYNYNPII